MFVNGSQADGDAESAVIEQDTGHGAGAVYAWVYVHAGVAEKVAVILHAALFDVNPEKLYAAGLVNGELSTTATPPQELDMVNVPEVGALVKETLPLTLYNCVAELQAVGTAETAEMLQTTEQGAGLVNV